MKQLLAALLLLPALALAQVQVDIKLPQISFEVVPPMVQVSTGVQVVENYEEEVFFVDGFYWCRRNGEWFQSKDHKGHWAIVPVRMVPVTIASLPPGKYKHWKGDKHKAKVVPAAHHEDHGKGHGGGKHKGKKK